MRVLLAVVLSWLCLSGMARADVIYAYPDGSHPGGVFRWRGAIVTDGVPLSAAVELARQIGGSRALEVRLLHREGATETQFALDLGSTQRALRWSGASDRELSIRGQIDAAGQQPRPLTVVVGRPLKETLCLLDGVDVCARAGEAALVRGSRDALDYMAEEASRRDVIKSADGRERDVEMRLHCLVFWDSAHVRVSELGLRDCWLAALTVYRSSNISLRDSVIEGSTYAFAAVGRQAAPEVSHTFEITGNLWKQSTSTYRTADRSCPIESDWNCPVSVWRDIPWGITHHFFWSHLNGALFAAKDIGGNVKIAGNTVIDAYNGVRVRLSSACLARPECRTRANIGFEISDNIFYEIRDNPIEPEGHASYWVIKHNSFVNVHAAISTDGVAGREFLVFGNVFLLDRAAGDRCQDGKWVGSRQFRLALGGGGQWGVEGAQGDDARCGSHSLGTIIKLGGNEKAGPGDPLLERILFFNNSVRTRSPLFRGSPAPPIISFNNVVQFTGCGMTGPMDCRQEPDPDPACVGTELWTTDRQSLFTYCFPTRDYKGQIMGHRMRRNGYSVSPDLSLDAVDQERVTAAFEFKPGTPIIGDRRAVEQVVAFDSAHPFATGGCRLKYSDGDLSCLEGAAPMGALLPDGRRYDIALPFGFPFDRALAASASRPETRAR